MLVRPLTRDAETWIADNVPDAPWFHAALAVEPRYLDNLLAGMRADGLIIRGEN